MRFLFIPAAALVVIVSSAGCGTDPLTPIDVLKLDNGGNGGGEGEGSVGGEGEGSVGVGEGEGAVAGEGEGEGAGNTGGNPGVVACEGGESGATFRSTLPALPSAVDPGVSLAASSGNVEQSCNGDGVLTGNGGGTIETSVAHAHGAFYFEVEIDNFQSGWSNVGVFASPSTANDLPFGFAFNSMQVAAAGVSPEGPGVISVAVDTDAGAAFFFANGHFVQENSLGILPGIGAFRAGGVLMPGVTGKVNLGSAPFAFGVPAGYRAWNSDNDGGACDSDPVDVPNPTPVTVACTTDESECALTGFVADTNADTELIVLGSYDTGGASTWQWGEDANGNPIEVPVAGGHAGHVDVDVERPGHIALVLSTYEPSSWTIHVGPDTDLVSVSVFAMHPQTVDGLADSVPLEIRTICTDGDGGNCSGNTGDNFPIAPFQWPYDTGGGDTQGFVDFIEAHLCLPLKMFAGSYEAGAFVVH